MAANSAAARYEKNIPAQKGYYLDWVTDSIRVPVIDPRHLSAPLGRKLRILWVTDSMGAGGAERLVETSARLLHRAGHSNVIWSLMPPTTAGWSFRDVGDTQLKTGPSGMAAVFAQEWKADVVILNNMGGADAVRQFHASGALVVVVPFGFVQWSVSRLRPLATAPDCVNAVWAYESICAGMNGAGYPFHYYSYLAPIELDEFTAKTRKLTSPRLAYLGRMSWEKNLRGLIDVFALARERIPGLCLDVIGGVDPHAPLPYQAFWQQHYDIMRTYPVGERLEAEGAIVYHGFVEGMDAIQDILGKANLCVLTSDFEGEPLCFLEAMALGIPCVGRRMSAVTPLLDGCGVMSTPKMERMDDAEKAEMVDGIVRLLTDRRAYAVASAASRARIERDHGDDAWVRCFESVMADLLVRRSA